MTTDEVGELVRRSMPKELFAKPGSVLYSPVSTLTPGVAYIMGLNPGGCPICIKTPIIDSIAPDEGRSGYTHECWRKECTDEQPCRHIGPDGATLPSALVRHQKNMLELTSALGGSPTTTFSANAIFGRSTAIRTLKAQTGHGVQEWWEACWPVHRAFLSIVRPRVIVTLGYGEKTSAFGLLRSIAGNESFVPFSEEGRAWAFEAQFDLEGTGGLRTTVIGVPHPSYHAPGPVLAERLREVCEGRLAA